MISTLCWLVTAPEGMAWSSVRRGLGWVSGKGSSSIGGWILEWAPQGELVLGERVQERFGQGFQDTWWDSYSCPLQTQELDFDNLCKSLPIYDSIILAVRWIMHLVFIQGNRRKAVSSEKIMKTCKLVVNTMRNLSCCSLLFLFIFLAKSTSNQTNTDWHIQKWARLAWSKFSFLSHSMVLPWGLQCYGPNSSASTKCTNTLKYLELNILKVCIMKVINK